MLESEMWASIRSHLKKKGFLFCRIENGAGVGMSDLFCVNPFFKAFWVELKVSRRKVLELSPDTKVKISWRPGQQGWGTKLTAYKQYAYTVVKFSDSFGMIKMYKVWENDMVPMRDITLFPDIKEVVEWLADIR